MFSTSISLELHHLSIGSTRVKLYKFQNTTFSINCDHGIVTEINHSRFKVKWFKGDFV